MTVSMQEKKFVEVRGRRMAYVEKGVGRPIVFLHGNPTSSFLWRNILGPVSAVGRCIAPDLIGMGDSDKLPNSGPDSYTFAEHQAYVEEFLDAVGVTGDAILVVHDWGSALGFDWARRHSERVRGIVYMESIVRPMALSESAEAFARAFTRMRSAEGEHLVLEENFFIEQFFPHGIKRTLTDEEMAEYRRPFSTAGEGRRPSLTWPRQMPLDGAPPEVVEVVEKYGAWLAEGTVPKLFVNAEPGAILSGPMREFCRSWPNQTEVTVSGLHFVQEDSPNEIAEAILEWLGKLPIGA